MSSLQMRNAAKRSSSVMRAKAKKTARKARKAAAAPSSEVRIGGRLRHARLVQKLRLRELADRLDCSESFLSKLENDKVRPSLAMLHRIVGILDINIATLFSEAPRDDPVHVVRANTRPAILTDPLI